MVPHLVSRELPREHYFPCQLKANVQSIESVPQDTATQITIVRERESESHCQAFEENRHRRSYITTLTRFHDVQNYFQLEGNRKILGR